jgi:hypothetical protein
MLRCSNYKPKRRQHVFISDLPEIPLTPTRRAAARVSIRMGQSADAHDLRSLLSVAARLRQLAGATLCRGDQALYLMTAEALEKRAGWLAGLLPEPDTEPNPVRHQPVDLVV